MVDLHDLAVLSTEHQSEAIIICVICEEGLRSLSFEWDTSSPVLQLQARPFGDDVQLPICPR
jgi:hypothetical protein